MDWSRIANNAAMDPISTASMTDFVPNLGGLMFSKGFLDGSARVEATLEAIAVNNDVRLLARPSLTVSNNQEGEIQIGAEVPVEAGQSIGTGGFLPPIFNTARPVSNSTSRRRSMRMAW